MRRPEIGLLLVDALNLIRRVHAARREHTTDTAADQSVEACVQSLKRALTECAPSHAVCVFEGAGPSFRSALYPGYKAGRPPMPDDLQQCLPTIKEAFLRTGVRSIEVPGMEADDIIATLAVKTAARKGTATILSTDKTFLQLLSGSIRVRDHFTRSYLDQAYVLDKFQVSSTQLPDLLALAGDPTNSIPGIPSVGRKTAARLLREYPSLESVLANASLVAGAPGRSLLEHRSEALLFKSLLVLKKDVELGVNLRSFRYGQ